MHLPIELWELVIDFLDDEQTLKTTSLVCKAWLSRSRLNLFRTIELCLPRHLDYFQTLLLDSPHLAPYLETVDVSENSLIALFRPARAILARLPHVISSSTPAQPRRLAVHNQLWLPTRYHPDYLDSLSRLTSLTCLDIFDVTFTTVADISSILRALPRLTSLSAKHLDCQRQIDRMTSSTIGCTLPCLTKLRVASYHPTTTIDWLLGCNDFPSIRRMDCLYELSTSNRDQGLGAFWKNTGETLEYISISISKRSAGARFPLGAIEHQLDLSHCRSLRLLRLDCRHERGVAPDWTWLTWLLSHLTCNSLSSITFAFQSSSHALACLHAFADELDHAIAVAPFRDALKSVVFEFDFQDPADPDDKRFVDFFPSLQARNVLRGAFGA
ncbi:hypothetical protein C8Q70DRAFT_916383 [Cubamyces menziesii]|nr:hypothetical protein C8Q70DRAFT_916383 [Cubamyces menziesii]